MSKTKIFIWMSLGYISGVLVGSLYTIEKSWVYGLTAFFIFIYICIQGAANTKITIRQKLFAQCVVLAACCVSFGIWRITVVKEVPNQYASMIGTKVDFEGVIIGDIDRRTDKQLLTIQPTAFSQRVLVTVPKTGAYFYGDRVWVRGKLVAPMAFDDFDYPGYLARYNVFALMRYPKVIVVRQGQGSPYVHALLKIKYYLSHRITRYIVEPESSLLLGILIGARKTLPQEVVENFNATGTSHIIAVSGFNITIIVVFLARFVSIVFGRKMSIWICSIFLLVFVILAGPSASVIRAALMGVLLLVAVHVGRLYTITPALCFAALIMLVHNPRILFWDAGFQLSFAATVGIVYGVPVLEKCTETWNVPRWITAPICTTVAAVVATTPLMLLLFDRMSIVAPITNVLVVPIISPVMLCGFLAVLPGVGIGFAWLVHFLLAYILHITAWFADLPFASATMHISRSEFVVLYGIVIGIYIMIRFSGTNSE